MLHKTNYRSVLVVIALLIALASCSSPTTPEPEPLGPAAILSIDSVETLGGRNVVVPIRLSYPGDPTMTMEHLGGFDLYVSYGSAVLTLVNVTRGPAIAQWEYFTWRTYQVPKDPNSQAHGVLIVAIRDMNNGGSPDPPQYYPEGVIGTVTFWATSDWNFIGTTTDIRFFSTSCGDNSFVPQSDNRTYYMADERFGPDSDDAAFDTMGCSRRYTVMPVLEFRNGTVTIEEPPPTPGDINLNNIPFEFGDLVIFSQLYRGEIPDVAPERLSLMIANADCNGDGEPLTLADYDYILSIILGGVSPSDPLPPPYHEELRIELVQDGSDWLIAGTSSSPVSGLLFTLISPSGSDMSAQWLGRSNVSFAARHRGDTLSVSALADIDTHTPILEGDWPPPVRIRNSDGTRPVIVSAQASTPPGSPMTVNVTQ